MSLLLIWHNQDDVDVEYCSRDIILPMQKSGIDKLIPNMKMDDYLFDPCGYSMNGILENVRHNALYILLHFGEISGMFTFLKEKLQEMQQSISASARSYAK